MSTTTQQGQLNLTQQYSSAKQLSLYVDSDMLLHYLAPNLDFLDQRKAKPVVHDLLRNYALDHALIINRSQPGFMADYLSAALGLDFICTESLAMTYLERLNKLFEDNGIHVDNVLIDVYPIIGTASAIFVIQEM